MNYRTLGKTGLRISEIGFGTWQLGGISWVSPNDEQCLSLLRHALDCGINLYDVSPSYGNGRSETLVGMAFQSNRRSVFLSGKVGVLEDGTYYGFWSPRQLRESVEQSLRRLRTDYFDILNLHAPPMDALKARYALELLRQFKEEGKARFIGVSLEAQPEEALLALEQDIDVLQIRFNLLFPEARRVFPPATAKNVGVIINSPLAHGYLSGRYRCYDDIAEGDYPKGPFRATKPRELVEGMIGNGKVFASLANGNMSKLPRAALSFVLAHREVASAIPGHRSMKELNDNLAVTDSQCCSRFDLRQAEELYQREILRNVLSPCTQL
jgi:aryl-alcohol dehydrogenase-like predicted oxidoreductase